MSNTIPIKKPELIPIDTIKPFTRFCCSIGMIPSSYKASMTYEEQLMWLCHFLEDILLPTINTNTESFLEIEALFEELSNYVEHYFDNLDVQQEINNKLDEMAEDGTLDNIVGGFINNHFIQYFDTVADLKNANLSSGQIAGTKGYYSVNDGGGAKYHIVNDNTLVDDGGSVIDLNNDLKAILLNNNVNVKQFGAYGDDTNDDTQAIQNAINYHSKVFFPEGTYYITNTINIPSNKELSGTKNTTITTHSNMICFTNLRTENVENINVHDLNFLGNVEDEDISLYPKRQQSFVNPEYDEGMATAFYFIGSNYKRSTVNYDLKNINIHDCNFKNIYSLPVIVNGGYNIHFTNNNVINCLDIGFIDNVDLYVTNNYVLKSADNGISISSGNDKVVCSDNIILYSAFNGIWISGWNVEKTVGENTGVVTYFGPTNVVCSNNIIKYCGHSGIMAKWKVKNVIISNNIIDTCYFNVLNAQSDSLDGGTGIKIAGFGGSNIDEHGQSITVTVFSENINIENNNIKNCKRNGIYIDRVNNFNINNNIFENIGSQYKNDNTPITTDDITYNNLIYLHNHDTCNADGFITNNSYKDSRDDKNTVNYINFKYYLVKAINLFIKNNFFFYYNDKSSTLTDCVRTTIHDYDYHMLDVEYVTLDNTLNTVTLIFNYLVGLGTKTAITYLMNCPSNVTSVLTKSEQSGLSYGFFRKVQANIYDYTIFIPSYGLVYNGRINNGVISNCFKITGSSI